MAWLCCQVAAREEREPCSGNGSTQWMPFGAQRNAVSGDLDPKGESDIPSFVQAPA